MPAQGGPRSGVSDGAGPSGTARHRARGGGFEWIAPSPSPEVVAELERLFPEIVQVPVHPLEVEEGRWGSHAILARCLSRWIPPEVMVREFHRVGLPGDIEALALANKHYIFHFSDIRAKALALERPWVIYGQPIITADWIPEFVPVDSSIHSALLWIRLPQLPIEFWSDEILSSILAVAGHFLYSDESTKERKRGSFARACVRVDLSKPLRPGARIRGSRAPFWQQFCYENLEGICVDCGSVHLAGSCQAVPDSSSSASSPGFGPWMAAIRRRKSPQEPPSSERSSAPRPPPASAGGWQIPKKLARRQSGKGGASLPASVELTNLAELCNGEKTQSGSSLKVAGERCSVMDEGLPGSIATVAQYQADTVAETKIQTVPVATASKFQPESMTVEASDSNPFACLGTDCRPAQSKSQEGDYSGPAKRPRPVELLSQRVAPRSSKAKGKVPSGRKSSSQGPFTFLASDDATRGSLDRTGTGKKKPRRKEGPGLQYVSGLPLPDQLEEASHDSAVLLLKKAIQRGEEAEAKDSSHSKASILQDVEVDTMDSSLSTVRRGKGPAVGSLPPDDHFVDELMGDMAGVPPNHASE